VTGLTDGTSYIYYVRCLDEYSNENTTDYTLSFSVANTPDTTVPILSNGTPSWEQASGTTNVNLALDTDENSTCRYSTTANTSYWAMGNTFATTWNTAHSTNIIWLTDGSSYTYYVRCIDWSLNLNISDYTISFSVAAATTTSSWGGGWGWGGWWGWGWWSYVPTCLDEQLICKLTPWSTTTYKWYIKENGINWIIPQKSWPKSW